MLIRKHRPIFRSARGQGLVEFALILPLLLLLIVGILDFGRMLFIYANLFNAAREASRYALTDPGNQVAIQQAARDRIFLVPPEEVNITIWYDKGPPTYRGITDPNHLVAGDRVIVDLRYNAAFITPLIQPFAPYLPIHVVARRTIQRVHIIQTPTPRRPHSHRHRPIRQRPGRRPHRRRSAARPRRRPPPRPPPRLSPPRQRHLRQRRCPSSSTNPCWRGRPW